MGNTKGSVDARTRARLAVASMLHAQRERETRIEKIAAAFFSEDAKRIEVAKQLEKIEHAQAMAVGALVGEDVSVAEIAQLLGIEVKDVRRLRQPKLARPKAAREVAAAEVRLQEKEVSLTGEQAGMSATAWPAQPLPAGSGEQGSTLGA